jgi:hypothetical protein
MDEREIRREALARALREHPDLAGRNDPDSLVRLNDIAEGFATQLRLEAEVQEVRRREFAESARLAGEQARAERAAEQARDAAERAEAERERREAERVAADERRRAKLQEMGRARRWMATHVRLVFAIAILLVLALTGGAIGLMQWQQNQAAAAAAQAAFDDAVRSCDPANLDTIKADQAALTKWLDCPNVEARQAAEDAIAYGTYQVGSVGPGGGIVFLALPTRAAWGQFLEAAPAGWSGSPDDPEAPWCAKGQPGYDTSLDAGTQIGAGAQNTATIIEACGLDSAAGVASSYAGGGQDDWFLPSKDELNALYEQREVVGGLADVGFWSSSQLEYGASLAWSQHFYYYGGQSGANESNDDRVRPVRAF